MPEAYVWYHCLTASVSKFSPNNSDKDFDSPFEYIPTLYKIRNKQDWKKQAQKTGMIIKKLYEKAQLSVQTEEWGSAVWHTVKYAVYTSYHWAASSLCHSVKLI